MKKIGLLALPLFIALLLTTAQTKPKPKTAATTTKPVTAVKKPATAPTTLKARMDNGAKVYLAQCLACHQPDGGGVPHMNPPLIKTNFIKGDKKKLIQIVLKGMNQVPIDDEDYSNAMAPHPELTDQEIADVLTYVRNSFGNKGSAVLPAEVKAVRATLK